ncbi:hypothetical protein BB560_004407 [Smittium megazygosporum]|uniref:Ras-GEF domain-containing protein n=1 Tax=Smittium megazygosporum TaxID=133381 RepID=A0A2T9Z9G3_9FUNG|nr:hypothetical protein BB560_004407 [Smittium megazygosporum]
MLYFQEKARKASKDTKSPYTLNLKSYTNTSNEQNEQNAQNESIDPSALSKASQRNKADTLVDDKLIITENPPDDTHYNSEGTDIDTPRISVSEASKSMGIGPPREKMFTINQKRGELLNYQMNFDVKTPDDSPSVSPEVELQERDKSFTPIDMRSKSNIVQTKTKKNFLFKSKSFRRRNKSDLSNQNTHPNHETQRLGEKGRLFGKIFGEDVDKTELTSAFGKSKKHWFLEPEYGKFEISYDMEGKVNGGTWDALIEYLTPNGKPNDDFNSAFMLTFRVFASSQLFSESLIKRYDLKKPEGISKTEEKIWLEKKARPVKQSVYTVFLEWFEKYWYGPEDDQCLPAILVFFESIRTDQDIPKKEINKIITKIENTAKNLANSKEHYLQPEKKLSDVSFVKVPKADDTLEIPEMRHSISEGTPYSSEIDGSSDSSDEDNEEEGDLDDEADIAELLRVTIGVDLSFEAYKHLSHIAQIDPEDVASQLTILQSECYCKITPIELLRNEFARKKGTKSPHVKQMIKWSNQISRWVAALILYEKTPEKRSRVIKYFLELALECLRLKNYSAVMDIQGALNSSAILRLKKTWRIATDPSRNYINYRNVLKKSTPPLLPFLGLYLTDLTFVCDGNPDVRRRKPIQQPTDINGEGTSGNREREATIANLNEQSSSVDIREKDILINFDKHYKVAQIIIQIQKYQIPYSGNFTMAIPGLQKYILYQIEYWDKENYDDDKLYNLSLLREPRALMTISREPPTRQSIFNFSSSFSGSSKDRKKTSL